MVDIELKVQRAALRIGELLQNVAHPRQVQSKCSNEGHLAKVWEVALIFKQIVVEMMLA